MSNERSDAGGYMGWFLFGAVLGAAATLLLTPKTGAQAMANDAQGRAGEWFDKSRELFEEQTQRLMTAFEAGKDAMREEIRKNPPRG